MGIDFLRWLAPLNNRLCVPLAVPAILVIFTAPALAAAPSVTHSKNEQPSSALQQKLPDADEVPLTAEDIEERAQEEARAALVRQMRAQAQAEVHAAARSVRKPDSAALAKALRVELSTTDEDGPENSAASAFKEIGDLDGDGVPEAVLRWSRPERFRGKVDEDVERLPGWILFLFSWDGTAWRVTQLMIGDGLCGIETLHGLWRNDGLVGVEGLSRLPYPVIFNFENHAASVAWDSRDETSRYQPFARGSVQFEEPGNGPPAMIVSGRADPGVIRFSPNGNRGFELATVYFWEGGAYVPKKTEFAENEDYTLYRFLSALHLRDFRRAFTLIDPGSFLGDDEKTLEGFRKYIEAVYPEFIGNNIFEAIETAPDAPDRFAFRIDRDDVRYTYYPTFSDDERFLLTGLERREAK